MAENGKPTSEQLQRMETNKRKAKERLATGKKQKQLCDRTIQVLQGPGPGTPVRVDGSQVRTAAAMDADSEAVRHCSESAAIGSQTESPVKSKRGRTTRNFCAVCLEEIIDGKHEAIFCEGHCKMWYHRGCASVSQKLFQELTASEEPFLCLMCSRASFKEELDQLKSEIAFLKSELKAIPSMQTCIEAPHRETINLQTKISDSTATSKKATYARVASSSKAPRILQDNKKRRLPSHNHRENHQPSNLESPSTTANPIGNQNRPKPERVVVPGVRRIWGTLKSASTTAVSSTLNKLTTLGNQLTVKKKVRSGSTGSHWWFLVKGSEEVLKKLEEEWSRVSLQINWKLEPCTKPKNDSVTSNPSPVANATHTITLSEGTSCSCSSNEIADGNTTCTITLDTAAASPTCTRKSTNQPTLVATNKSFLEQDQLPQQTT